MGKPSYMHTVLKDIGGQTFNSPWRGTEDFTEQLTFDLSLEEVRHEDKIWRVGHSRQRK